MNEENPAELQSVLAADLDRAVLEARARSQAEKDLPTLTKAELAELLFEQGFAAPHALAARVQRWRDLFDVVAPSAVITDHAPTALLTARALGIPAVQLGTGFAIPPVSEGNTLPAFRDWESPNMQRMAHAAEHGSQQCDKPV